MKKLDLTKYDVTEMNLTEMKMIEGGLPFLVVAGIMTVRIILFSTKKAY